MTTFEVHSRYDDGWTLRWSENLDKPTRSEWTYVTNVPNDPGPPDKDPVAHLDEHNGEWEIWVKENDMAGRQTTEPIGLANWEPAYTSL